MTKMEVGDLKKKMRTCNAPQHKSPRKGMHMIGIGRYEKGVTTNAAFQVRDEVALPEYQRHRKLRSAQRRFFRSVKPLLKESPTTNQFRDKVKAVKEWVELQILEEEFKAHYPGTDDIHSEAGGASNAIAPSHSDTTTEGTNTNPSNDSSGTTTAGNSSVTTKDNTTPNPPKTSSNTSPIAPTKSHHATPACTPSNTADTPSNPYDTTNISKGVSAALNELKAREARRVAMLLQRAEENRSDANVMYSVPTPKTTIYPSHHKNAKYELLNSLNINVMDRSEGLKGDVSRQQMEGILRELVAFNEDNNEPIKYETSGGGNVYRLVKIPVSNNEREFRSKAKKFKWIEEALESSLADGSLGDSMMCMIDYLASHHSDVTQEQLRALSLTPKQMSEFEMAATMKAANIGIGSWREIVKCFVTFTEMKREQFTMSEHAWRKLGTDHGKIEADKYSYQSGEGKRTEKIQWWTMDPASEMEMRLADFAN